MKVDSQAPATTAPGSDTGAQDAKGYREDQGRLSRMFAFWACVLLLLFGCTFLYGILAQYVSLREPVQGAHLPILGIGLSPAFLICLGIFSVGSYFVHRWQARPQVADLLIETEAELRKVTWPTFQEVINSSMVVIVCVLILFAFLAAADWFLARVMGYLLLGKS